MNGITHKQAIRLIHRRLDGLLNESQVLSLEEHLRSCEPCRAYSTEMDLLPARLQNQFHIRWDEKPGPSQKVIEHVTTKASNIPMANRISSGVKLLAGVAALVLTAFLINFVISHLWNASISGTQPNNNETTVSSLDTENRLLAFTSEQNGNFDIYTVRPDGSDLTNLTNNPADDRSPVWSPDGRKIAFTSDRAGNTDIFLMNVDGSNLTQLTDNPSYDDYFSWSPDGQKIIYSSRSSSDPNDHDNQLVVMTPDGSNKIILTNEPGSYYFLSWSPDGQKLLYQKNQPNPDVRIDDAGIYIQDLDNSNQHAWLTTNSLEQIHWEDLQHFYGVSLNDNSNTTQWSIYRFNTNGEAPEIITSHTWTTPISAIFENTYITEYGGALRWYPLDGSRTSLVTQKFSTRCINPPDWNSVIIQDTNHAISPDGKHAFVTIRCNEGTTWFYLENADGSEFKQLTDFFTADRQIAFGNWSPDGKYVNVTVESIQGDSADLYLFDIEKMLQDPSTQPIPLTTDGARKHGTVWQPRSNNEVVEEELTPEPTQVSRNDDLIAFTSTQNGNADIYTMHADGSGLTNLTNSPAYDSNPFWSPDGKRIAFVSAGDGSFGHIYLMDADGADVVQLTHDQAHHEFSRNYGDSSGPWSPDGNRLIFSLWLPGEEKWTLYTMDINGENKTPFVNETNIYSFISWSPDGKHIAFIADDPQNLGGDRLYVVNPDGSNLREVTKSLQQNEQLSSLDYYWSPDGRSIYFIAFFQKPDPYWTVYEADLDSNTLVEKATTSSFINDWQNGTLLVTSFASGSPFKWLRSDGTNNILYPYEKCQQVDAYRSGSYIRRSPKGNWVINAYCPNGDSWFYWANSTGTVIKELLNAPISAIDMNLIDIVWSPDDKFIIFNMASPDKTDLYILNISESLKDPSVQPVKIPSSEHPSWQPNP